MRRTVVAGTILLWSFLILGMLGRLNWLFELFAHFRVHYAVLFVVLAVALVLLRLPRIALAALAGALLSALPLVGYLNPQAEAAASVGETFRLVSLNVWFRNHDYARVAAFLEGTEADVIIVQEAAEPAAHRLHAMLPSYPHAHISSSWHGAVVFSRWPLTVAESTLLAASGSPGAHVQIDWRGAAVTLLGVHLHWPLGPRAARLRNQELAGLSSFARSVAGPMLVAGDFNVTPWSPRFQDAVAASGLNDCASGQGLAPTWPSYVPWLGIRIDHCLASDHWRVVALRAGPHVGSDHRPVIVELALRKATSY